MTRRIRHGAVVVVAAALIGGASGTAFAKGVFKGTFGDVQFKAKKRTVGCHYDRAGGLFIVIGTQVKQHGRLQSGISTSGSGADPSAPGTTFPIVLTGVTATFLHGPAPSPPYWIGIADLGQEVVLTLTGFKRKKVFGTLVATLTPAPPAVGPPIQVNATFNAKCTIQ